MVGAISETGNGWYFGGQHFDSINLLLATLNTELQKQDLQVYELERRLKDEGVAYSALAKSYEDMKLQNREYLDHIEWAWGVIANAGPEGCLGNWKKLDTEWVKIAENWRDKYHDILAKREKRKCAPECCKRPAEVGLCCICDCHDSE